MRKAGYQVIAVAEESPGLSDAAGLGTACALGAILLTFDRDYGELVFKDAHPPPRSIFLPSPDELTGVIAGLLSGAVAREIDRNFVVWSRDGIRKRLFPMRA